MMVRVRVRVRCIVNKVPSNKGLTCLPSQTKTKKKKRKESTFPFLLVYLILACEFL